MQGEAASEGGCRNRRFRQGERRISHKRMAWQAEVIHARRSRVGREGKGRAPPYGIRSDFVGTVVPDGPLYEIDQTGGRHPRVASLVPLGQFTFLPPLPLSMGEFVGEGFHALPYYRSNGRTRRCAPTSTDGVARCGRNEKRTSKGLLVLFLFG